MSAEYITTVAKMQGVKIQKGATLVSAIVGLLATEGYVMVCFMFIVLTSPIQCSSQDTLSA